MKSSYENLGARILQLARMAVEMHQQEADKMRPLEPDSNSDVDGRNLAVAVHDICRFNNSTAGAK